MQNKFNLRVKTSKYEFNDPNYKNPWKDLVEEIEKNVKTKTRKIKRHNLSKTLPTTLYNRVSKVIKLQPIVSETDLQKGDENETLPEKTESTDKELSTKLLKSREFNESTVAEVLDLDNHFLEIDLKIDPQINRAGLIHEQDWMTSFLTKRKKDRILWQSKFYKLDKRLTEKPMFEQAEQLIDLAAADFSEWINSLSSDSKSNITKELIKELFPIGLEGDATKAIYIEPKQITAIPDEMGKNWNLPELSLEKNVARLLELDLKEDKKPTKYIAFGKNLQMDLRHPKPGRGTIMIKPKFPEDLKTKEILFRGINHLRSTKAFVQHLLDHPEIPKPKYLLTERMFEAFEAEKKRKHIPLYQQFV